jgi:hypothetical protein
LIQEFLSKRQLDIVKISGKPFLFFYAAVPIVEELSEDPNEYLALVFNPENKRVQFAELRVVYPAEEIDFDLTNCLDEGKAATYKFLKNPVMDYLKLKASSTVSNNAPAARSPIGKKARQIVPPGRYRSPRPVPYSPLQCQIRLVQKKIASRTKILAQRGSCRWKS